MRNKHHQFSYHFGQAIQSDWYRDFILSHPDEEDRQRRLEDILWQQKWNLNYFFELIEDPKSIPKEEAENFTVVRNFVSNEPID